jgi:hypothetical protein
LSSQDETQPLASQVTCGLETETRDTHDVVSRSTICAKQFFIAMSWSFGLKVIVFDLFCGQHWLLFSTLEGFGISCGQHFLRLLYTTVYVIFGVASVNDGKKNEENEDSSNEEENGRDRDIYSERHKRRKGQLHPGTTW